ncbi:MULTISPECIES: hypothetical protein [Nitrosomonas]|uniref:Uncharacterized protein n=2 Tax=Nitrosomonas communis TaxID=44574 RepID=A0A0F7KJZ4_9PROT|nr:MULTISPECIES: hypothetical protein [Nitrosomonas]AKH39172.1 hypothetical protein AAW31_17265 [Nitrosomonas communis]UVS61352.1 hypothetical protein NX761_18075 [Nitrosomonas sp. PLL12]
MNQITQLKSYSIRVHKIKDTIQILAFLIILWLLLWLPSVEVHAFSAITRGGYVACTKKEWLEDMFRFSAAKDIYSLQSYLDSRKCIILKEGLLVTVKEFPDLNNIVGFTYRREVIMWANIKALDYRD